MCIKGTEKVIVKKYVKKIKRNDVIYLLSVMHEKVKKIVICGFHKILRCP